MFKWLLTGITNTLKWLFNGIISIVLFVASVPTLLYLKANEGLFYPYEFLDNMMYSIFLASIIGIIISFAAAEILTEPEYDHYSHTTQHTNVNGFGPYVEKVRYEFTRDLNLTKEEKETNRYIRDFFAISILPIGIYFLILFSAKFSIKDSPNDRWYEIAWALFLVYIVVPFVICIVSSIILYFVLNRVHKNDRAIIWAKIKKWIVIGQRVFFGNIICCILWFWLIKLEFYHLFGF